MSVKAVQHNILSTKNRMRKILSQIKAILNNEFGSVFSNESVSRLCEEFVDCHKYVKIREKVLEEIEEGM